MRRHIGTGAGRSTTALCLCVGARGEHEVGGGNLRALGNVFGCVGFHRLRERIDALHIGPHEVRIEEVFFQDHADHAGEDGAVLTGFGLQVHKRTLGAFGAARVDHHDFHTALHGVLQALGGVLVGHATGVGHNRVHAHEQPGIGIVEDLRASLPGAVQRRRNRLARLVDGVGGEHHVRADGVHPRRRDRLRGRVGEDVGAGIGGHGTRAVFVDDALQFLRDLVHGLRTGEGRETAVFLAADALEQPVRVPDLVHHFAALDAGVTPVHGVVLVADDAGGHAVLAVDHDRAHGGAGAADAVDGVLHRTGLVGFMDGNRILCGAGAPAKGPEEL